MFSEFLSAQEKQNQSCFLVRYKKGTTLLCTNCFFILCCWEMIKKLSSHQNKSNSDNEKWLLMLIEKLVVLNICHQPFGNRLEEDGLISIKELMIILHKHLSKWEEQITYSIKTHLVYSERLVCESAACQVSYESHNPYVRVTVCVDVGKTAVCRTCV